MSEINDPSVAAQILCRTLRIRDYRQHRAIAEIIEDAVKDSGQTMEQVINRMQIQWELHRQNANSLEWAFTYPEKFFFSPIWQDERLWPWKRHQAGTVTIETRSFDVRPDHPADIANNLWLYRGSAQKDPRVWESAPQWVKDELGEDSLGLSRQEASELRARLK